MLGSGPLHNPDRKRNLSAPQKITVVGTGYVGISNAVLLAQHNRVVALDIDARKVEQINAKISPIADPEIEDYLANRPLDLVATTDREAAYKDADFVIELGTRSVVEIARRLGPDFRLDPQMSFETLTGTRRYEMTVAQSLFRIELFLLSDDPYDRERFRRRRAFDIQGRSIFFLTAEDVVVTKLRWGRGKDLEDVQGVIAAQADALDWDYIHAWCDRHGTRELLEEVRRSIPPLEPPRNAGTIPSDKPTASETSTATWPSVGTPPSSTSSPVSWIHSTLARAPAGTASRVATSAGICQVPKLVEKLFTRAMSALLNSARSYTGN